ncbi:MAG TPA: TlpA family protein disulfide reductase [Tessaracoccus flavescens]|uniref:TlpA family protein disulfide reductase n=1 Tax=Tessaracoccus flavescens TaxID=399497 RepID=A0A921EN89_9ACTN|nr:TlpA family protein disulfide reductase [Tessaracoccus flavescens]
MRRLAASLAAVLLLSACSGQGGTDGVGFQGGDGTVTILDQADRVAASTIEGTTLDGKQLSTADFAGKTLVINVWGSWCAPCRSEAPHLVEAHEQLGDDVAFLGINTRDLDVAPAQAFERSFEIPYPSLFDPNGELLLSFGQLPPKAIPSTVVIDTEGKIAARVLGEVNASTLVGIVNDVQAGT